MNKWLVAGLAAGALFWLYRRGHFRRVEDYITESTRLRIKRESEQATRLLELDAVARGRRSVPEAALPEPGPGGSQYSQEVKRNA